MLGTAKIKIEIGSKFGRSADRRDKASGHNICDVPATLLLTAVIKDIFVQIYDHALRIALTSRH